MTNVTSPLLQPASRVARKSLYFTTTIPRAGQPPFENETRKGQGPWALDASPTAKHLRLVAYPLSIRVICLARFDNAANAQPANQSRLELRYP